MLEEKSTHSSHHSLQNKYKADSESEDFTLNKNHKGNKMYTITAELTDTNAWTLLKSNHIA